MTLSNTIARYSARTQASQNNIAVIDNTCETVCANLECIAAVKCYIDIHASSTVVADRRFYILT